MKLISMLLCVTLLCGCTSDSKSGSTTPVVIKINSDLLDAIRLATKVGTDCGFKFWAKKDPNAAQEAAKLLGQNLTEQIIPYFKPGIEFKSSAEIEQFLKASLFDKLPAEVKDAVVAAFKVLDFYLPVPDSKTYLDKDQIKLIVAFLTGVQQGCAEFVPPAPKAANARQWLAPAAK